MMYHPRTRLIPQNGGKPLNPPWWTKNRDGSYHRLSNWFYLIIQNEWQLSWKQSGWMEWARFFAEKNRWQVMRMNWSTGGSSWAVSPPNIHSSRDSSRPWVERSRDHLRTILFALWPRVYRDFCRLSHVKGGDMWRPLYMKHVTCESCLVSPHVFDVVW